LEAKLARLRFAGLVLLCVLLIALAAWLMYWATVVSPGLRSADPRTFLEAHMSARRWGIPLDGGGVGDAFLASAVRVSEPAATAVNGGFDEELQFVVGYDSLWQDVTGAPPGPRQYFVYVGRDRGQPWRVLSSGTGP
jgi:uncharacterized membrane protein YbhN (UPF0104 family)